MSYRGRGRSQRKHEKYYERHYGATQPQLVVDLSSALGRLGLKTVEHYLTYRSVSTPVRINVVPGHDPKFRFEVGDRVWRHEDVFDRGSPIRVGTIIMLYQRLNTRFGNYREEYVVWWDDGTYHRGLLRHGATPVGGLLPPAEEE